MVNNDQIDIGEVLEHGVFLSLFMLFGLLILGLLFIAATVLYNIFGIIGPIVVVVLTIAPFATALIIEL